MKNLARIVIRFSLGLVPGIAIGMLLAGTVLVQSHTPAAAQEPFRIRPGVVAGCSDWKNDYATFPPGSSTTFHDFWSGVPGIWNDPAANACWHNDEGGFPTRPGIDYPAAKNTAVAFQYDIWEAQPWHASVVFEPVTSCLGLQARVYDPFGIELSLVKYWHINPGAGVIGTDWVYQYNFPGQSAGYRVIGAVADHLDEPCNTTGDHLHQSANNSNSSRPNKHGNVIAQAPFALTWSTGDDFSTTVGTVRKTWTGSDSAIASFPLDVSALFRWDNTLQQFRFWFRGFPESFNTLGSIVTTGGSYHVQASAVTTVNVPTPGSFVNYEPGEADVGTVVGANEVVWSGVTQVSSAYFDSLPTAITAVFKWNSTTQSFSFWYRGFPSSFNTLANGPQRGEAYFFQASSPVTFYMY